MKFLKDKSEDFKFRIKAAEVDDKSLLPVFLKEYVIMSKWAPKCMVSLLVRDIFGAS